MTTHDKDSSIKYNNKFTAVLSMNLTEQVLEGGQGGHVFLCNSSQYFYPFSISVDVNMKTSGDSKTF